MAISLSLFIVTFLNCSSCRKVRRAAGELRILQSRWAYWPKTAGGSSVCFWQSPQSCHPPALAVGLQKEIWPLWRRCVWVSSRSPRRPGGAAQVPDGAVHFLLLPVPQPLPPALQEPLQTGLPVHVQQNSQGEHWAGKQTGTSLEVSVFKIQQISLFNAVWNETTLWEVFSS